MIDEVMREALLSLIAKIDHAAKGITDPGVSWDAAATLALSLTPDEAAVAATCFVRDTMRDTIRATVRDEEMRAVRLAEAEERRESDARRRESLYLGKYRHGSMSKRDGAAYHMCPCQACADERKESSELRRRHEAEMDSALNRWAAELRIQWTNDLLETSFALGDGTTVTWADATVEDHQRRIEMLSASATATMETAAKHAKAVADIRATGASTLREALGSQVAA